jgi:hypothetical protein
LSSADRWALDVSDFDRVLVAAGADWRIAEVEVFGETSWQPLVGAGRPPISSWPLDASVGGRYHPSDSWLQFQLALDVSLSKSPSVDPGAPLSPTEPRVTVIGSVALIPTLEREPPALGSHLSVPPAPTPPVLTSSLAGIEGRVSSSSVALEGAIVRLSRDDQQLLTATTDSDGRFAFGSLGTGPVQLSVEHQGYRSLQVVVLLAEGRVEHVPIVLEQNLSRAELRGNVRSFKGRAIGAVLRIEPLGIVVATDKHGAFQVELPPGTYRVIISARGYAAQERQVGVRENSVTYWNVELYKAR